MAAAFPERSVRSLYKHIHHRVIRRAGGVRSGVARRPADRAIAWEDPLPAQSRVKTFRETKELWLESVAHAVTVEEACAAWDRSFAALANGLARGRPTAASFAGLAAETVRWGPDSQAAVVPL